MIAAARTNSIVLTGSIALLLATAVAAYTTQLFWLAVPVVLVSVLLLLPFPVYVLYALLAVIPWSAEVNLPGGFGTDLPDEPLMLLLSFFVMLLLLAKRKKIATAPLHPLLLLLLAQLVWMALTVALSTYPVLSIKYLLAKTWYITAFVAAPVLLWQEEEVFKNSIKILFGSMVLVTLVALVRHAADGFSFAAINAALYPFFRNHVNYSALLVCLLPVQVFMYRQASSKKIKRLLMLSFFITLPALYFSYARGAWLALLTGAAGYVLLRKGWLFKSFVMAVLFCVAAVLWLKHTDRYLKFAHDFKTTIFHQDFNEHLAATYQLKDVSTAERFHRWVAAVRMAEDSWPAGFGPTTFYQQYKSYTVPAFKTWVSKNEEQSTVHNYFLLLLVEQGVIGLLLFSAFIGALFWYAQRIYGRTHNLFWKGVAAVVAVILVMQCTLNFLSDLIETDKVGSVFYLCVAVLVMMGRLTERTDEWNREQMNKE